MRSNNPQLTILVTRPGAPGLALCDDIIKSGDVALHLPTIAFVDETLASQDLRALADQDWLIFVSPHGVQTLIPQLLSALPTLPAQVKFAAVGAQTKAALQAYKIENVLCPLGDFSSEGLLQLPEMQTIKNQKVALIRGHGGRELLAETLQARGAILTQIVAYRRVLPTINMNQYIGLLRANQIAAIICASYDSVQNLTTLIGENDWLALKSVPLIVVSERIKMLAQDLNFQTIWVAREASNAALIELLAQKRKELCQMKM